MTMQLSNAFVQQFGRDVKLEYQRMGSHMRNIVRREDNIEGTSHRFFKAGKGEMGDMTRGGDVPLLNASRGYVDVSIADHAAGELVRKLDLSKITINEQATVQRTLSAAAGRKTDNVIFDAMKAGSNVNDSAVATTWSSASPAISIMEKFGKASIPFDGQLYATVPWEQWGDLLDIDEFDNADYVPSADLWMQGITAKKWLGFNWAPHEGLPKDGSGDTYAFFHHKSDVGHVTGTDLYTDITWQGFKQAWLFTVAISQGAGIIDNVGVIKIVYDTTP